MGAPNRDVNVNLIDRYESLRLKESLAKSSHYVFACKELSFIMKNGYSKFPKNLQSLIFQDSIFAFNLLPMNQTQFAISAANSLLQSAEFALPKQKRAMAVKEHKHAIVACKRKSKANHEEDGDLHQLPQDVLAHIFSFLDVLSLVSASAVCRLWNSAAYDNHLWKHAYIRIFSNSNTVAKHNRLKIDGVTRHDGTVELPENTGAGVDIDWRCAYKNAFKESCGKFSSKRGYCHSCCLIVWISSSECFNKHFHQIHPISSRQILDYIMDGMVCSNFCFSDSDDSDSEDTSVLKLWAYPRQSLIQDFIHPHS